MRNHSSRCEPIGYHVMMRLEDGRPIATSIRDLRVIAKVCLEQGEERGEVGFGTADNHLHAVLVTDRVSAGAFALYAQTSLRMRLGLRARFEPARLVDLRDQNHVTRAFHYVQRQDARHELGRDPFREGTSLPDLLGLRLVSKSRLLANVRAYLPRVQRSDLVAHFPAGVLAANGPIDLDTLAAAAAAALALPDLKGQNADVLRARRAAVHAAGRDVRTDVLSECLGIGIRAVQILRASPDEPAVTAAVRRQALLRTAMANLPSQIARIAQNCTIF